MRLKNRQAADICEADFFSLNYSMHIGVRQGFFREDKETVLVNPRGIWYTVKQDGRCFSYGFNVHGV